MSSVILLKFTCNIFATVKWKVFRLFMMKKSSYIKQTVSLDEHKISTESRVCFASD